MTCCYENTLLKTKLFGSWQTNTLPQDQGSFSQPVETCMCMNCATTDSVKNLSPIDFYLLFASRFKGHFLLEGSFWVWTQPVRGSVTSLLCNSSSHWLSPYPEWSQQYPIVFSLTIHQLFFYQIVPAHLLSPSPSLSNSSIMARSSSSVMFSPNSLEHIHGHISMA